MQALTLTGTIDSDRHLRLDMPTQLPAGNVELVVSDLAPCSFNRGVTNKT